MSAKALACVMQGRWRIEAVACAVMTPGIRTTQQCVNMGAADLAKPRLM
ncbi:hypothetical protein [Paenalcaligenes hominis]|nr:hypothetical protein [Paenalcaligenes hominis]